MHDVFELVGRDTALLADAPDADGDVIGERSFLTGQRPDNHVVALNNNFTWTLNGTRTGEHVVKIGDKDTEIDGAHTYVIRYTVKGAING